MITREFLDKTIPDTHRMWELASKITSVDLANGYRSAVAWRVYAGLEWLAAATERAQHYDAVAATWPIRAHGLLLKPSDMYLTAEGWPLGTTCWYVLVECGSRWYACAETQHLAVLRGVVLVHALALDSATAPQLRRKSISELIQQIVTEFTADR